jgi:DNA polymerase-4/DNA polymerase V
MPIYQVRQVCPDAIVLPTDYETCSLFSKRMFAIMRRYAGTVEEYGIDEGFMDITGLTRVHKLSYQDIAETIRQEIEQELGITVSVGLAPTKVLAKIASKFNKPNGLTIISSRHIPEFLRQLPVSSIWGVGKNTTQYMWQLGIHTAEQFVNKPYAYIQKHFTKPHQEIWQELKGESVYPVIAEEKTSYASISKTRTFTPANMDKNFVYSQLIKNVENACIKARQYNLVSKKILVFVKTQQFQIHALEAPIPRASAYPNELMPVVKKLFDALYTPNTLYRTTGITLSELNSDAHIQSSLFEPQEMLEKMEHIYAGVDKLAEKFGKHTVHLGSSLAAHVETARRRLSIPLLALQLK